MALAIISVSCELGNAPASTQHPNQVLHQWHDDGGPGRVSVRISLPDQIAEFQRGDRDIGWCYVATGKEGHGTSAGGYSIMEKIEDKHSNRYGWIEDEFGNVVNADATPGTRVPKGMVYVPAPMPYWMRITSYGIGMHGGLIPEPGKPASHGCIRMPKEFVPLLYAAVTVGTPVTITHAKSKRSLPIPPQAPTVLADGSRVIATRPLGASDAKPTAPVNDRRLTGPVSAF